MAKANVTIDTDRVIRRETDDRGRITLGIDHAETEVEVAILETENDREQEAQPAD